MTLKHDQLVQKLIEKLVWAVAWYGVGARIPRPRCATIDLLAIVATAGA